MKRILIGILCLFALTALGQITTKNVVPNTNNTGWIGITNKKWQGMMSYTGKFDYLFGNAAGLTNVPAGTGAVASVTLLSSNTATLLVASNGTTGNVTNWFSVIAGVTDTNTVLVLASNMAVALDNGVLQTSTNYANTILQSATNYADSKDILILQSATNYANTILQAATNYTDSKIILVLQSATNYANTILQSATNYADSKDILVLQSATNYANTILQSATNYANTILQSATNYADSKDILVLQSSTNYANSLLSVRSSWYLRSDWTNSAFTNNGYILAPTYNSATTNTAIGINATADGYLMTFITTNQTFTIISDGSIVVDFDAHRDGNAPDTLVVKPELYLFTNNVPYVEFADATPISLTTTRAHYRSTIILTTNVVPAYANTQIGIKFKCVSQTGLADIMYLWTGSNAVSVVEIPTPSATLIAAGTLVTNKVVAGANITVTQDGNDQITIASTGGSGGGESNASYVLVRSTNALPNALALFDNATNLIPQMFHATDWAWTTNSGTGFDTAIEDGVGEYWKLGVREPGDVNFWNTNEIPNGIYRMYVTASMLTNSQAWMYSGNTIVKHWTNNPTATYSETFNGLVHAGGKSNIWFRIENIDLTVDFLTLNINTNETKLVIRDGDNQTLYGTTTLSNITAKSGTNMIINAQSVGIGTNSPLAMLHIHLASNSPTTWPSAYPVDNPYLFRVGNHRFTNILTIQSNSAISGYGLAPWSINADRSGTYEALFGYVKASTFYITPGGSSGGFLGSHGVNKPLYLSDTYGTNFSISFLQTGYLTNSHSPLLRVVLGATNTATKTNWSFDGLPALRIAADVSSPTTGAPSNYPASLHVLGNTLVSNKMFLPARSTDTFQPPTTNELGPGGACFANSNGTVWIFSCDSTGTVLTNTVLFPGW